MSQPKPLTPTADARPPFFVGVDLGATAIVAGLFDDAGCPLARSILAERPDHRSEGAADQTARAVAEALRKAGFEPSAIARLGVSAPASREDGPAIAAGVNRRCGLPVTFADSIDAAAYGEFWIGAGRGFHSLVLLNLDTHIDCGIIVDRLSLDDQHRRGAECGHLLIDSLPTARLCCCGQRGHFNAYGSVTAVIERAREAVEAGRASLLRTNLDGGQPLSLELLREAADGGDPLALEIIAETARSVAVGITSLLHTVDPSGVLLAGPLTFGGSPTALGRRFLGWVREEIAHRAFPLLAERTVIDFAVLGEDARHTGAAGLARKHSLSDVA